MYGGMHETTKKVWILTRGGFGDIELVGLPEGGGTLGLRSGSFPSLKFSDTCRVTR